MENERQFKVSDKDGNIYTVSERDAGYAPGGLQGQFIPSGEPLRTIVETEETIEPLEDNRFLGESGKIYTRIV